MLIPVSSSATPAAGVTPGFDLRPGNVVAYVTPSFSGAQAALAYVTGVSSVAYADGNNTAVGGADNNKLSAVSLDATYTNGPIYAGFAYERHNTKDLMGGAAGSSDPSAWRLGGSYTYGPAKVGMMWEQIKAADLIDEKRSGATLFGTYGIGAETIKVAYTFVGNWKGTTSTAAAAATAGYATKANLLALGVDHSFSKRTTAYAQYTKLTNKGDKTSAVDGANYSLGGGGGFGNPVATGVGDAPSAVSVGLIHKF